MTKDKEPLIWRLYLVREALHSVIRASNDNLPSARMRAILTLDHSVELLLGTVLPELGVIVDRQWGLPRMLNELCKRRQGLQLHKTAVGRLHNLRNDVQHDGIVPSQESTRQAQLQSEAFIRAVIKEVLNQELEQISPVSLVNDVDARPHLIKAEEAMGNQDYRVAVSEAAIAFAKGWENFRWKTGNSDVGALGKLLAEAILNHVGNAAEEAARHIDTRDVRRFAEDFKLELGSLRNSFFLEDTLDPFHMVMHGVESSAYARFRKVTPRVLLLAGGSVQTIPPETWLPSQQDGILAVDFAVTSLLVLQRWEQ